MTQHSFLAVATISAIRKTLLCFLIWTCASTVIAAAPTVVEYVNTANFPSAPGGHYFYSADPGEQAAVDGGIAGAYQRTGLSFPTGGTTAVCRFYGSPSPGPNSHFFTANAGECNGLRAAQRVPTPTGTPQWNYEGLGFFVLPICSEGSLPVHRAYNNGHLRGIDANHRFSTSKFAVDALVTSAGWTYEGIAFCVPDGGQAGLISEVLACGTAAEAGGLASGNSPTDLKRHNIDLFKFPDAVCNDGTAAVMYFRPFVDESNRNKWVIQLQGGGSCGSPDECAKRWCSADTNFGMTQMTANVAPPLGIKGQGILVRASDGPSAGVNPHDGYNHVFLRYCSSDSWTGTARDSTFEAPHPVTSVPTRMRVNFLGAKIFDAAISTLRQDGVPALRYTSGSQTITMPDLDDANEILFAGASAGGAGVTNNIDRLRGLLRSNNSTCSGSSCPLVFRGLIDSHFGPSLLDLDFSRVSTCVNFGVCTPETYLRAVQTSGQGLLWKPRLDQSCLDILTPLGTNWRCYDDTYIIRNHLSTPFFVRMGLTDELVGTTQIEAGFGLPGQPAFTTLTWAQKVRADLLALASIRSTAVERDAITFVPGVFGPSCSRHETLGDTPSTYQATVRLNNQNWAMFDVWNNWIRNQSPFGIVSSTPTDAVCPSG